MGITGGLRMKENYKNISSGSITIDQFVRMYPIAWRGKLIGSKTLHKILRDIEINYKTMQGYILPKFEYFQRGYFQYTMHKQNPKTPDSREWATIYITKKGAEWLHTKVKNYIGVN